LWQEAPRGAGAAIGLAGAVTGCVDAGCEPHRSAAKTATGKNRIAGKIRMRLPVRPIRGR
jgi:hypothetical protein